MLDAPELSKRLCAAMDMRDPPLRIVDLRRLMGVSKQTVYEWRTTGRIAKGRLVQLAEATGMPLEFYLEPERGSSPVTKAIWRKLGTVFARVALLLLAFTALSSYQNQAEAAFNITQNSAPISRQVPDYNTHWMRIRRWFARFQDFLTGICHGSRNLIMA